mgnify:CR=1 FL=1
MARTLIWNTSATAQTLPAAYGGGAVQQGYGWIVSDESAAVVTAMGGFEAMHGKWAVAAISTDEALGSVNMNAAGVALIADVVSTIGGGGSSGPVYWSNVQNKPAFAAVATSGSYTDLADVPVLADVATSGAYADLSGAPAIPVASNTTPAAVGSTGSAGVLNTYARGDHAHAHGNQAGGTLHSAATTMAAGFMSSADKSKLDGLATVATSGAYGDLSGKPALAAVATSGSYTDLTGKPTLSTVATSGSYVDLTGTPTLAVVAESGSYVDLIETPNLAAVALSGAYADLSGKPSLAAVATSGAYADLSGKPSLATVATSGSYADLSNKPTLFSGEYTDLTGKPSLATVATSGSYTDLTSKPSLATVATSGSYNDLSNKPTKTYDIASFAPGSLSLNTVTMKFYAPKALSLTALSQGGGATIKIQVDGADITYPKSVTVGQVISAVVTVAGTDNYFTISAVEA